ncbi:MAG TPA: metalloregulator ArsR/SmtB family transcription factor [Candidatus Polarisedimenticolia bacterium]|nr:metalloregulator ArsR/SmtB family transcription factor [Candidatus Polarisedimenticolia bacterium]
MPRRDPRGELEQLDAILSAIAHSSRRQILLVLRFRGGSMTAGEIASRFSCSWPTTTRHLAVLVDAGLISVERRGRERIYRLQPGRLLGSARAWLRWFEPGDPGDGADPPGGSGRAGPATGMPRPRGGLTRRRRSP